MPAEFETTIILRGLRSFKDVIRLESAAREMLCAPASGIAVDAAKIHLEKNHKPLLEQFLSLPDSKQSFAAKIISYGTFLR